MDTSPLAAAVPAHVREVCARLSGAGHQAVTVGGCVRDVLLGRTPGDWDVATSADPEEVQRLFRHTIATGLAHGTVTVVMGKGAQSHVEVTTFRGEGAYSDARRPDSVTFGVPLIQDLERRDLIVNAMAYDPGRDELIDPFGGRDDIAARVLRAVGDPVARFTEDGLRVMRAVRFAAQLEFALEPATEASIVIALPSLAKVSRERVSDELRKLLHAREPSRGLIPAHRTGIIASILPDLMISDVLAWAARVDRAAAEVRLAALMLPLAPRQVGSPAVAREAVTRGIDILRTLKFSNAESELAGNLVGVAHFPDIPQWTDEEVRRGLARIDASRRASAIGLWRSEQPENRELIDRAQQTLDARTPLAVGDLAISGKDLMNELAIKPGPAFGRLLALALDYVLEDPARNTRETLLARVRELAKELAP
jgi:tRNA nucleotidyltransferase (CCA-adding enzyme)